ncbi:MAG: tol-pal system protein YbgF [Gammaproteobacteria bacterium]|nr:tol-pal system protein YbgF [Gammaproteobacteria bacterium]
MYATRPVLLGCSLAALLAGCAVTPPQEDPVQLRLNDLDARLGRAERVVNNQSLVDLGRRVDALEAEQRALRGTAEELQNAAEGVRRQQRDLYADLDRRLAALESGPGAASGAAGAGSTGAALSAGSAPPDQADYARAVETLRSGDYAAAIARLREFMSNHPQSALLDNAQYWLGEAYYVTRDYERAAGAFRAVGERWPDSRKAPDALLKLGYTLQEQKRLPEARAVLGQVVQRFAGSDAARLAAERLRKLGGDAP